MNTLLISIACILSGAVADQNDQPSSTIVPRASENKMEDKLGEPDMALMHGYERFLDDPRSFQIDRIA